MKASLNKYKRWIIVASLLVVILFGLYINKYQQLVNEGSYLADEHCIKVNPLIIDRKNKYTDQYNLLIASASTEMYMDSLDKYQTSADNYIRGEEAWLPKQRKFLDNQWFNLLIPAYIKEASQYQYQMYEAEYKSSLYLTQAFKEKDPVKQVELSNKVLDETKKANEAQDKYNAVWEREKGRSDWIYHIVKVPTAKCPSENYNIPEVPNPFILPTPVSDGETKG